MPATSAEVRTVHDNILIEWLLQIATATASRIPLMVTEELRRRVAVVVMDGGVPRVNAFAANTLSVEEIGLWRRALRVYSHNPTTPSLPCYTAAVNALHILERHMAKEMAHHLRGGAHTPALTSGLMENISCGRALYVLTNEIAKAQTDYHAAARAMRARSMAILENLTRLVWARNAGYTPDDWRIYPALGDHNAVVRQIADELAIQATDPIRIVPPPVDLLWSALEEVPHEVPTFDGAGSCMVLTIVESLHHGNP